MMILCPLCQTEVRSLYNNLPVVEGTDTISFECPNKIRIIRGDDLIITYSHYSYFSVPTPPHPTGYSIIILPFSFFWIKDKQELKYHRLGWEDRCLPNFSYDDFVRFALKFQNLKAFL